MLNQREAVSQEAGSRLAAGLGSLLTSLAGRGTATFRGARTSDTLTSLPGPLVALSFRLTKGASGPAAFVLPGPAGLALVRLLLGEDPSGAPEAPGPDEQDALGELANQVAGVVATGMGEIVGASVGFEVPTAEWLPAGGRALQLALEAPAAALSLGFGEQSAEAFLVLPRPAPPARTAPVAAELPSLPESAGRKNGNGIEMLLDISLPVTVELGRTRMIIRDILHLAPGSVLELDKMAGEPVDILINDKSIARGEVVVIDENFGVRLTSIVTPSERVMNLQ